MIPLLYLTSKAHRDLIPDEKGIDKVFAAAGVRIDVRAWDETDWGPYRNILIRTPWDYASKPDLFLAKIEQAARRGANVLHPAATVRWNIDKRYLVELSEAGHKVVPTHVEDGFTPELLPGYFGKYGELVLKPRIGAGGRDTFRVSPRGDLSSLSVLKGTSVLIQPFVPEIGTAGEHSFVFFGEKFSHAVLKTAREGEFRVQDRHGGTVRPYAPSAPEIAEVTRILKAAGRATVYARVDVVRWKGSFHLMELEILEPELFFRFSPAAMSLFAQAVKTRLK